MTLELAVQHGSTMIVLVQAVVYKIHEVPKHGGLCAQRAGPSRRWGCGAACVQWLLMTITMISAFKELTHTGALIHVVAVQAPPPHLHTRTAGGLLEPDDI